jgi:hypothetical protein
MAVITVTRGDTRVWNLLFRKADGSLQPLQGLTLWWTVRPAIPADPAHDLPDAEAIIRAWWQHSGAAVTGSGVVGPDGQPGGSFEVTSPDAGQATITLLPRLTTQLATVPPGGSGSWRYDVQLMFAPDDVRTWDDGSLKVEPDVTRRQTVP